MGEAGPEKSANSSKNRSRARTVFRGSIALLLVSKVNWQQLVRIEMVSDAMEAARK